MNILQTGASIILLTMVIYFIMVNLFAQPIPIQSDGHVKDTLLKHNEESTVSSVFNGIRSTIGFNNKLPIEGINTDTGPHITGVNKIQDQFPINTQVLGSALYNADAKGVLPQNHDLFEKNPNFTSDITNINQFYKNNPELFNKSPTYVPNVADWDQRGQEMLSKLLQTGGSAEIQPFNFEHNFTSLL